MAGLIIAKFGGSLLRGGEGYRVLADEVARLRSKNYRVVVVVSAMKGVTDLLYKAAEPGESVEPILKDVLERYTMAAREAIDNQEVLARLLGEINTMFSELFKLVWAVHVIGEAAPHVKAMIISYGEMLSAALASGVLRSRGIDSVWLHGGKAGLVASQGNYMEGIINYRESSRRVPERLQPLLEKGVVPVVMGFTAYTPTGQTVLLGRGGSDYTATLLARFLSADMARLYTDVDGIYTSDPRRIPSARHIPELGLGEAIELALLGAKRMHPRTFEPVEGTGLTVSITMPGSERETLVREGTPPPPVKAVVVLEGQSVVTVSGGGLAERVGIMARISSIAARNRINLKAILQPPTETVIALVVNREAAPLLARSLEAELSRLGVDVDYEHASLINVVGHGVSKPEISAEIFRLAAREGGVLGNLSTPGSNTVSLLVEPPEAWRLAERIHEEVVMEWWRRSERQS